MLPILSHLTSAALAAGRRLPLLLAVGLASCGGPGPGTEAVTVPPTTAAAHDSVQSSLITPAPDGTATRPDTAGRPVPGPVPARPLPKPKAALPRPVRTPVAATAVPAAGPAPEAVPAPPPAPAAPASRTQVGRVLDEAGHPLAGATVMLKGSTQGTSTDADGNYTFQVPSGENTFVVGYGGYEDEMATARDGQPLNVTLVPRPGARKTRRRE